MCDLDRFSKILLHILFYMSTIVHSYWLHYYCFSMDDGLLLKPTHPVISLDSTFVQRTFGEGGPKGQLWAGHTMYDESQVKQLLFHVHAQFLTIYHRFGTSYLQQKSKKSIH